ncbi:MAG: diguanylate cyclase [Candidatus Xenobia bacterium]
MRDIATGDLVFYFVLYGCLPLWTVMGFLDWLCHRRTHIERTSGLRESVLHAVMGVQVGIPVCLGLYCQINVLLLLVMFGVLVVHEMVAHYDVRYARGTRHISMAELHVHSFLEVIPFTIVALVVCMNWPAFYDLVTLHWHGQCSLTLRPSTLNTAFYTTLMLTLGVAPYVEEIWRCWRHTS